MSIDRITHLIEQMHRSEDDAGDPIADGMLLAADGIRGQKWVDPGTLGGPSTVFDHGNMGATETIDLADGDWHRGTLNANCAITVQGFTLDEGVVMLVEIEQVGGFGITWDADIDFGGADDQPNQTAATTTTYLLWSSAGDSTIYGAKVGAAVAVTALDDLSDVTITSPQEDDSLRYVGGVWINDARWKALVVDGFDSFVWEGDDLVWEWE